MTSLIALAAIVTGIVVFDALAIRFGADSRVDPADPTRSGRDLIG